MSRGRALAVLIVVAALAAALLAGLDTATRDRIADNEAQRLIASLDTVLPGGYDNDPHLDLISVSVPGYLGSAEPLPVFRARRAGEPAGLAITAVAPDGYVDAIRLLIGITADGEISGVRVISHSETPGLGDGIELERSDWIRAFEGRRSDATASGWSLRRDGGDFDQLTGATITSRAVLNAVRRALEYYELHRAELYALPSVNAGQRDDD